MHTEKLLWVARMRCWLYATMGVAALAVACTEGPRDRDVRAALDEALSAETRERRVLSSLGMQSFLPELESAKPRGCEPLDTPDRVAGARYVCEVLLTVRQWGVLKTDVVHVVIARDADGWRLLDDPQQLLAADGHMRPDQNQ